MVSETSESTALRAALCYGNRGEEHCCPPPVIQLVLNFPPMVGYRGLAELKGFSVREWRAIHGPKGDSRD